jgi:hypothetical protein
VAPSVIPTMFPVVSPKMMTALLKYLAESLINLYLNGQNFDFEHQNVSKLYYPKKVITSFY